MNFMRVRFAYKIFFAIYFCSSIAIAQNSMVGDGFGGRLWYQPTNYTVGSYSAFSLCYANPCDASTNQLYGWGNNAYGELGDPLYGTGSASPVPVPNMTNVLLYSTGYNMGAIKNNGTGWVWGYGLFSTPTQVITNAKFVDGSIGFVSFVKNDGTVWSIGDNTYGNFGDGTYTSNANAPVQMLNISSAVRVANGFQTAYILLASGTVMSVGANLLYNPCMLGGGPTAVDRNTVGLVNGLSNVIDIKSHSYAIAALDNVGDVYVWGESGYIGNGTGVFSNVPVKVTSLSDIVAISGCADGKHFLALDANKNCYAWGSDIGQYGAGPIPNATDLPVLVATDVIDIMAGEFFSYIVKSDGTLWATGYSNGSSIWLNLPDVPRDVFTQLNPALVPGTCSIVASSATVTNDCGGANGTIAVNNSGGLAPYQYNIGSGNQTSNVFSGLAAGNYTITITDANACVTTLTAQVNAVVGTVPVITVNSASICPGTSVNLNATGAATYVWSNAGTLNTNAGSTVIASPLATTVYTVVGTNANGCSGVGTATVTVAAIPTLASNNDSICGGEAVNLSALGQGIFIWSPSNSLNTTTGPTVIASPSTTTVYSLQSTNGTCVYNQSITIVVNPTPIANFSGVSLNPILINSLITLTNTSANAQNIQWKLCDGTFSTANTINFNLNSTEDCCIKLVAENNNCFDSTTKCVEVYEPYSISIPNIFSPNEDKINDVFSIPNSGIKTLHCEIYNRWGTKIFEWDGLTGYWDGKIKNVLASEGVYYYIVNYSTPDKKQVTEKGFLTLVK